MKQMETGAEKQAMLNEASFTQGSGTVMEGLEKMGPFADLTRYERLETRAVRVGGMVIGGGAPLSVQSMTTSSVDDVEGLVAEITGLYEVGAELVRMTVPSLKAVPYVEKVKARLESKGLKIPLVADVHFTPNVALAVAPVVEKVRINPGNYLDKKRFAEIKLTDAAYQQELERIEEKFARLLEVCRKYNTAMRVGVNHGSLSDRIVTRYGDSPYGMMESAMEFLEIAKRHNFDQIVVSMKSSNPVTMVHAYRLLVARMKQGGQVYPLHLGVTEAGDSVSARVKSAAGMAVLLADGIGDTIRVSLTEDSRREIPVCQKIRHMQETLQAHPFKTELPVPDFSFYQFARRKTQPYDGLGGVALPLVFVSSTLRSSEKRAGPLSEDALSALADLGWLRRLDIGKWEHASDAVDGIIGDVLDHRDDLPPKLRSVVAWASFGERTLSEQKIFLREGTESATGNDEKKIGLCYKSFAAFVAFIEKFADDGEELLGRGRSYYVITTINDLPLVATWAKRESRIFQTIIFLVKAVSEHVSMEVRALISSLDGIMDAGGIPRRPTLLTLSAGYLREVSAGLPRTASQAKELSPPATGKGGHAGADKKVSTEADIEALAVAMSFMAGPLCVDGWVDGVYIQDGRGEEVRVLFQLLQATRRRMSRVDYISCPSCGRTLFDLQEVTARIKMRTKHLKHVKIGIMGCIVNGPGEMADADYGYVGSGVGAITLYKGREIVKRAIPENEAVDALVELIREHGQWNDPT